MNNTDDLRILCFKVLIMWKEMENVKPKMEYSDNDMFFIKNSFISQCILKKFNVFGIEIHLPANLLMLLSICSEENPGKAQLILKELLKSIKEKKGPIEKGYVITTADFKDAFPDTFPIINEYESLNEKYEKLWDEQKKPRPNGVMNSDNKCDTPEWWFEVMA